MTRDFDENFIDLLHQIDGGQATDTHEPGTTAEYPYLPLQSQVIFPHVVTPLFIDRDQSVRAVETAFARDRIMVTAGQEGPNLQVGQSEDVYFVGTEVEIIRVLRLPDGTTSALVQGRRRVVLEEVLQIEPYPVIRATPLAEPRAQGPSVEALMRAVLALFEKCVRLSHTMPEETYVFAMNVDEPGWLADLVASSLDLKYKDQQALLEEITPETRLQHLSILLARELDVLELEDRIHSQVQQEVDRSQREYFLREQMRVIQNELGEGDISTSSGRMRGRVSSSRSSSLTCQKKCVKRPYTK